uniref:Uncharacterized protein n=3 Tax=Bursaphelenchus xylophilus TaxID=6326 RepID=A0A1I7SGU5_BURXY
MVEKQAESPASSSTDPPSQIHQLSTNQRAETDPKNDAGTSESLPQNNTLP